MFLPVDVQGEKMGDNWRIVYEGVQMGSSQQP